MHQIALALKNYGYGVHVICFNKKGNLEEDYFEGISIHRVKMRLFFKLRFYAEENIEHWYGKAIYRVAMLLNKIKKILYLPFYPLTSPIVALRYFSKANELMKKQNFNMVISVYNPLETLIAGAMIKRRNKDIKFGMYVLDTLTNGAKRNFIPKKWTEKKGWQWEQRLYKISDIIFNMKCHETHHEQERYDKYRDKMQIVDIPLFIDTDIIAGDMEDYDEFDPDILHWVYTGALSHTGRNPKYVCEIFTAINGHCPMKLHFYSRGDCESLIKSYEELSGKSILRHGYVDKPEATNAISNAKVLISIGNQDSDMIPSKIFEYMSTGKKIIHFYTRENDSCIEYYNRYPNALLVNESKDFNDNKKQILDFLLKPESEKIDLNKCFKKNTPNYTVELIDRLVSDGSGKERKYV